MTLKFDRRQLVSNSGGLLWSDFVDLRDLGQWAWLQRDIMISLAMHRGSEGVGVGLGERGLTEIAILERAKTSVALFA